MCCLGCSLNTCLRIVNTYMGIMTQLYPQTATLKYRIEYFVGWPYESEYVTNTSWPCKLTHWGRVTHICVRKLNSIDSDNGRSPGRRQAIIWTNAGILLIRTIGTNFSGILSEIHTFSFKKMHLKMSSGKWRPSCLGLNVLSHCNSAPDLQMSCRDLA